MIYFAKGSPDTVLTAREVQEGLFTALDELGPRNRILAIPPDITRYHSQAGLMTEFAWQYYGNRL